MGVRQGVGIRSTKLALWARQRINGRHGTPLDYGGLVPVKSNGGWEVTDAHRLDLFQSSPPSIVQAILTKDLGISMRVEKTAGYGEGQEKDGQTIYKSGSLWLLITRLQVSAECSLHLCHPCSLHICDQHLKRATHSQVWAGHSRSFSLQARWHLFTGHPKLFDITPDWVPDKVNVTFLLLFVVVVDNNT